MTSKYPFPKLPLVVIYYPSEDSEQNLDSQENKNSAKSLAIELATDIAKEKELHIELRLRKFSVGSSVEFESKADLHLFLQTNSSVGDWKLSGEISPKKLIQIQCEKFSEENHLNPLENALSYYKDDDKNIERTSSEIIKQIFISLKADLDRNKRIDVVVVVHNKQEYAAFKKLNSSLNELGVGCLVAKHDFEPDDIEFESLKVSPSAMYSARCLVVLRSATSQQTTLEFLKEMTQLRAGVLVVNVSRGLTHFQLPVPTFEWKPNLLEAFFRDVDVVPLCEQIEFTVTNPVTVFVAYSRKDSARMFSLKNALEMSSYKVLVDRVVRTGEKWEQEVVEFILCSDAVIGLISDNSAQSKYFPRELEISHAHNLLVPVTLGNNNVPKEFEEYGQATSLYQDVQPHLDCLKNINSAILNKCRSNNRALIIHDFESKGDSTNRDYFNEKLDGLSSNLRKEGVIVKYHRFKNDLPNKSNVESWVRHQFDINRRFDGKKISNYSKTKIHFFWDDALDPKDTNNQKPALAVNTVLQLIDARSVRRENVFLHFKGPKPGISTIVKKRINDELPTALHGRKWFYLDEPNQLVEHSNELVGQLSPNLESGDFLDHPAQPQREFRLDLPDELPPIRLENNQPLRIEFLQEQLRKLQPRSPWYREVLNTLLPISALIGAGSLAYLALVELPKHRSTQPEDSIRRIVGSIDKNNEKLDSVSNQLISTNKSLDALKRPKSIQQPSPEGLANIVAKLTTIEKQFEKSTAKLSDIEKQIVKLLSAEETTAEKIVGLSDISTQISKCAEATSINSNQINIKLKEMPKAAQIAELLKNSTSAQVLLKSVLLEIKNPDEALGAVIGTSKSTVAPSTEMIQASYFYYSLAIDSITKNEFQNTVAYLTRAIDLNPRDPRFFVYRGLARRKQGMNVEAAQDIQIATSLESESPGIDLSRAIERIQGQDRLWIEKIRNDPSKIPVLGSR